MKTKNEIIFASSAPWDNVYQGHYTKVLFICSAGILRSATAAHVFAAKGYNTRCAGSEEYALIPVTGDLLLWADKIVFVNKENFDSVANRFSLEEFKDKIQVCDIPDNYDYRNPTLVTILEEQVDL